MLFLETVCGNYCQIAKIVIFAKKIMNIVFFIVPMLLIVMITVDFVKSLISSEGDMKKSAVVALKRILAAAILFLIPVLINTTAAILDFAGVKGATFYRLATKENIDTNVFDDLEKEFSSGSSNSKKVINSKVKNSSGETISSSNNYKLSKSYVVIGHCSTSTSNCGNKSSDCSLINNYTIKITDKSGKQQSNSNFTYKIDNNAIASVSSSGQIKAKFGGKTNIHITSKNNKSQTLKLELVVINSIYTKVKTTKKITAENINSGKTETLKAGTKGIYNGIVGCKSYGRGNILKVGNNYYDVSHTDVDPYDYYITDIYSTKEAEEFVNSHGFNSKTNYLFWSSHGAQVQYMFTGSKGKWKIAKINNKDYVVINTGDFLNKGINKASGLNLTGATLKKRESKSGFSKDVFIRGGSGANMWHQQGTTKRKPASNGCTRFNTANGDWQWLLKISSKIMGSHTIDY